MMWAALLGAGTGLGVWLAIAALRPRPVPLADALAALDPWSSQVDVASPWTRAIAPAVTDDRRRQLRLADLTVDQWARNKVLGAAVGVVVPLVGWAGLTAVGMGMSPLVAVLAIAGGAAGWWWPNLRLVEQRDDRRKAFLHALSSYLDLVNIILAGGGGVETALVAAADAGDGWAFRRIRFALARARRTGQPIWTAFQTLGEDLDINELRELGASITLSGTHGARIRQSLAAKADTLRSHQLADAESDAEEATERMNIPTAVLLGGFLVFVVFPAVTVLGGGNTDVCVDPVTQEVSTDLSVCTNPLLDEQ